jgi:hypothetical protein
MAMNFLKTHMRPTEVFDVQNRKHRELFAEYVRTNRWDHSPVRFVASEPTQVDVGTMSRQLLEFYSQREFGDKGGKKELTARQNGVKLMTLGN